ncbi:MAG: hypothetical protein AABW71_01520 [Nanoarchaeota archaeon]
MKKILMILALSFLFLQTSSALCNLIPTLINQDPISAVPGETVKVLFQITGTENPECGTISLQFVEEYPFTLDSGYEIIQRIQGGTYQRDFNPFWIVSYKVRVDSNALDGDQKLSIKTWLDTESQLAKVTDFNITVEEVRTDFIITLDSYSFSTNKLVLGIVNVGENNAQSITVEVPQQENALIEGGHVKILGELDSNEDTTVTFDAALSSGPITINLEYNDKIGERRKVSQEVVFSELAFENTKEKSSISFGSIMLWLLVIGIVIYLFILRRRKAKHRAMHLQKFNK